MITTLNLKTKIVKIKQKYIQLALVEIRWAWRIPLQFKSETSKVKYENLISL